MLVFLHFAGISLYVNFVLDSLERFKITADLLTYDMDLHRCFNASFVDDLWCVLAMVSNPPQCSAFFDGNPSLSPTIISFS